MTTAQRLISSILLGVVYRVNWLSSSGYWGESLLSLRDIFPFPYMPAGRTFGLAWSMIYISLAIWIFRLRTSSGKKAKANRAIIEWFWTSCLLNILWILFTSQQRYVISVITITSLMVVLWKILNLLSKAPNSRYVYIPFGLYAGRITMATSIVGISQLVYTYNTTLPLTLGWSRGVILCGIIIAGGVFKKRNNWAQASITLIALIGVAWSMFGR